MLWVRAVRFQELTCQKRLVYSTVYYHISPRVNNNVCPPRIFSKITAVVTPKVVSLDLDNLSFDRHVSIDKWSSPTRD